MKTKLRRPAPITSPRPVECGTELVHVEAGRVRVTDCKRVRIDIPTVPYVYRLTVERC